MHGVWISKLLPHLSVTQGQVNNVLNEWFIIHAVHGVWISHQIVPWNESLYVTLTKHLLHINTQVLYMSTPFSHPGSSKQYWVVHHSCSAWCLEITSNCPLKWIPLCYFNQALLHINNTQVLYMSTPFSHPGSSKQCTYWVVHHSCSAWCLDIQTFTTPFSHPGSSKQCTYWVVHHSCSAWCLGIQTFTTHISHPESILLHLKASKLK